MTTYTVPSGKPIAGGREIYPHASLDLIAEIPERTWVRLNANLYADAWPPSGLRTPDSPRNMFRAWSSFAWDSKRHGFWFWGGGHANYSGNEVYFWSAVTRLWSLAFHTSTIKRYQIKYSPGDGAYNKAYAASDGIHAPLSAHTYNNNIYLPILDRFLTFGGAGQGLAEPFEYRDESEELIRRVGAYTLQPALAGQDFLGGLTGLNYQGTGYESALLPGAKAWEPKDWLLDNASYIAMNIPTNHHINGGAVYKQENGRDVLYWTRTQVTSKGLVRTEFVDHDYRNDIHTKYTGYNDSGGGQGGLALDPERMFVLEILRSTQPIKAQAFSIPAQTSYKITAFEGDEEVLTDFYDDIGGGGGLDFDPIRRHFVAWGKGPRVYRIDAPETLSASGWAISRLNINTTPAPIDAMIESQTSTLGKWAYADDMDCYIGAIEPTNGHVWAFKPANWNDPRG